jgi:hypothetical protein
VIDESAIRRRFEVLAPVLDEQGRRRFAAAEAMTAGPGGVSAAMRATGIARSTIRRGLDELADGDTPDGERVRRAGGGRKPLSATDMRLIDDLRALVEPETRGDPQSPLLWTCKSLRKLSQGLRDMGHKIGRTVVGELLYRLDYRLQANRKTREGASHPDRDAQFRYINDQVKAALAAGEPAISVDTKKKELVGDFKNGGREWRPKGSPEEVRVHDFVIPELGRAVPYGVYDIADNAGWVSVGIDHDTASFATNAIRSWWQLMGRARPLARKSAIRQLRTKRCGPSSIQRVSNTLSGKSRIFATEAFTASGAVNSSPSCSLIARLNLTRLDWPGDHFLSSVGAPARRLRIRNVLKFSPQFTSSVLFDQVINFAQT